jgi:phosphatidylethanolamine-binding protein (PEBP) family uncharacterized protein
VVKL